jgi:hypothetical protein
MWTTSAAKCQVKPCDTIIGTHKVHRRFTRSACQRRSVRGVMSRWCRRCRGSNRASAERIARSAHDGRGVATWRRSTASYAVTPKSLCPSTPVTERTARSTRTHARRSSTAAAEPSCDPAGAEPPTTAKAQIKLCDTIFGTHRVSCEHVIPAHNLWPGFRHPHATPGRTKRDFAPGSIIRIWNDCKIKFHAATQIIYSCRLFIFI